jgi:Xaa-Pro dipeptidase
VDPRCAGKSQRLNRFQSRLRELGIDAAILLHSRDLYYFAGTAQPCVLLVTAGESLLFVRRALDFVLAETWLDRAQVIDGGGFQDVLAALKAFGPAGGRLGLELDALPAELFLKLTAIFAGYRPVDVSGEIARQRMRKDSEEIACIEEACRIMNAGHRRVLEVLREGVTELELAAEVECAQRKAGHEGILAMRNPDFYISRGPLASGENLLRVSGFSNTITGVGLSAAVPAGPSRRRIGTGELVVVDIPTCHKGYHCDETRTYVAGRAREEAADLFGALREISDSILSSLSAGRSCAELFEVAAASAESLGVAEYFLGVEPRRADFIGHGIGLDANEPPILRKGSAFRLETDFVLTVEVHLSRPGCGAVKLEDVVRVREDGCEPLSITERELFETG